MHTRSVTLAICYIATPSMSITDCFFRHQAASESRQIPICHTLTCTAALNVPRFNTRVGTLNSGLDHLCGYCTRRAIMAPATAGTRSRPVTSARLARLVPPDEECPCGMDETSLLRWQFHCALVPTSAVPYLMPNTDCHRTIND